MAGGAVLADDGEDGVAVAVGAKFLKLLGVSGCFALAPEFLAGAGEVCDVAGLEGLDEGVAVHPGKHEHAPVFGALGDDGDEAVGVKAEFGDEFIAGRLSVGLLQFGEIISGHGGKRAVGFVGL